MCAFPDIHVRVPECVEGYGVYFINQKHFLENDILAQRVKRLRSGVIDLSKNICRSVFLNTLPTIGHIFLMRCIDKSKRNLTH